MTLYTDPRADDDIELGANWLETFNTGAGTAFVRAVNLTLRQLLANPGLFGRVFRPPRGREVRQGRVNGYPFLLTYEVTSTQLIVMSVGHAKQRSQPWRRRMAP